MFARPETWPSMLGAPLCGFLGVLFLTTAARGYRRRAYGALGVLALLGAAQLGGYFVLRTAVSDDALLQATRLITLVTICFGPAWLFLSAAFLERPLDWRFSLALVAGLTLVALLLGTELVLRSDIVAFHQLGVERQAAPGTFYHVHTLYFVACVATGVFDLARTLSDSHQRGKPLPEPLADTVAEEGLPTLLSVLCAATLVGAIDGLHLIGAIAFQLPIELAALLLIGGSAWATVQRFPRLLLKLEEKLTEVSALNTTLSARNAEIAQLAKKNEELLSEEIRYLRGELATSGKGMGAMIGASPAMRQVFELVGKVAPYDASVLITGETGTGKEKIAREIHAASQRSGAGFYAINVAAVPENLLESELFGHRKGAFTGAISDRPGIFRAADGGTLFFDEIGEMPAAMQVKLLRVLQEREVTPLGDSAPVPVDVRVLAATHRDLSEEVRAGRFREDLYYRLNVIVIEVPPLRARTEDIAPLAAHFLARYAQNAGCEIPGISPSAVQALTRHGWPGNVRELENVIERAVTLCEGPAIRLRDLPEALHKNAGAQLPEIPAASPGDGAGGAAPKRGEELPLRDLEKRYILGLMDRYDGERGRVAELLGINPSTLYRKLKSYESDS
ncbi:MAG: sigma 54-interacting transcriptional regulator [Chrysiogenetes bacterium]|nr:sigma 54-interacting transcriptional regulator [Chrysiogenetes bacterium]